MVVSRAAVQGIVKAHHNLGNVYDRGHGVPATTTRQRGSIGGRG